MNSMTISHRTARSSLRIRAAALLAVAVTGIAGLQLLRGGGGSDALPFRINRIEFVSVADFSDDRRLVGFAESVFIGEVVGEGRTTEKEPVLETDFPVRVLETIKGPARGAITVTQQGGFIPARNELRLMDGDRLLEPGKSYLFATRADPAGRQFAVPEFGDLEVLSAAHRDELRIRFRAAYAAEVPYRPEG